MGARTNFLLIDLGQVRRDRHAHKLHGFDVLRVVIGAVVRLLAVVVAIVIDNDTPTLFWVCGLSGRFREFWEFPQRFR